LRSPQRPNAHKQRKTVPMLLRKAAQDEAVVARLLPDATMDDVIIGFHAQQAVEKALKAWLAHLGVDFPKIHNLKGLIGLLSAQGRTLPPELADVTKLTPYAIGLRYTELPPSDPLDRTEALRLVQGVRAHVERIIGEEPAGQE